MSEHRSLIALVQPWFDRAWHGLGALSEPAARSHPSAHPRDPVVAAWFGGGSATASGASVTPETALGHDAVWACVRLIAETMAALPLIVYQRGAGGDRERDRAHRLNRVLSRPNRWQTPFEFWEMLTGHVTLRGVAYAEKIATGTDPVAELVPLHPDRIRAFYAPDGALAYDYQPLDGPSRIILGHEMFTIRGHGSTPTAPKSPITVHRETIGVGLAAAEYEARFLANDARPSGVLESEGTFKDDDARQRFKASWQAAQTGANRHKTALLEDGLKYHEIGMSNVDAQFAESRKMNAVQIARIHRVPPHKIGILDRATFSNIEAQGIEFVTDTVLPWARRIEQSIARDLMTDAERRTHFVEYLLDGLLRGDTESRFKAYAVGRMWGWLSANDVRRLENKNGIGPGGDVYLSPINMMPADGAGQAMGTREALLRLLNAPPSLDALPPEPGAPTNGSGEHNA